MIQNLSIQDFILIEKLDLDLQDGLCVITGQTGAGKSILLSAILFALGGSLGKEVIRANQEQAVVTLTFSSSPEITEYLENHEIKFFEELIIKRIQHINGRKKFFINDQIVSQKTVSDLFDYLLEIHGQHNHTALLNVSSHLEILDQFAENYQLCKEVSDLYKSWQSIISEITLINQLRENMEKEIEYLFHICKEYDDLAIKAGEEEELATIKKHLQTRDREVKLIDSILADLEGTNIEQIIARAQRNISKSENVELYDELNNQFEEIYNKTEEAKSTLNNILHNFDLSEHNLVEIEDRLYAIRSLARKHNCMPSELEQFISKSKNDLEAIKSKLVEGDDLSNKMLKVKAEYFAKAKVLSERRQNAAKNLEKKTALELSMLDMKKAKFSVEVLAGDNANSKGIDDVRFMASTNPGMPSGSIDKIASGGELSRFMLALRAALFDKCLKPTIIFDEIDVGISGSVADSIGDRLKLLSKIAQVIVITHQPQVAGKASQHILVHKTQGATRTSVEVTNLDSGGRTKEIARMISGKEITEKSLAAAKELIV